MQSDLCAPIRRTLQHTIPLKPLVFYLCNEPLLQNLPLRPYSQHGSPRCLQFHHHVHFLDPDFQERIAKPPPACLVFQKPLYSTLHLRRVESTWPSELEACGHLNKTILDGDMQWAIAIAVRSSDVVVGAHIDQPLNNFEIPRLAFDIHQRFVRVVLGACCASCAAPRSRRIGVESRVGFTTQPRVDPPAYNNRSTALSSLSCSSHYSGRDLRRRFLWCHSKGRAPQRATCTFLAVRSRFSLCASLVG